jgi:hypothetical protein
MAPELARPRRVPPVVLRSWVLGAVLGTAFGATPAVAAPPLVVQTAVLRPDARALDVRVRCNRLRDCRGSLRVSVDDGTTIAKRREARVPGRGSRTFRLPVLGRGLGRLVAIGPDRFVLLELGRLSAPAVQLAVRPSCRSGSTLARSGGAARIFRLGPLGVWACASPQGTPRLLVEESSEEDAYVVELADAAGPVVAYAVTTGGKCYTTELVVVDPRTDRERLATGVSTSYDSDANGCSGTGSVGAMVLRRSGAIAWTETKGDSGVARVRAWDGRAERTLDESGAIDTATLAATDGERVTWLSAGVRRFAELR